MRIRTPRPDNHLDGIDLFAGCTAEEIETIRRVSTEIVVPAGSTVWHEQRTRPQFVVVLDGCIELSRAGGLVATLGRGAWFGHVALLARRPAEDVSGVVGSAPARLLAFSRREFASLLHVAPAVADTVRAAAVADSLAFALAPSRRDEIVRVGTTSASAATRHWIRRAPIAAAVLTPGGAR